MIFQLVLKAMWFSLAIFVKNFTDKINVFTRKVSDENALITNFNIGAKP